MRPKLSHLVFASLAIAATLLPARRVAAQRTSFTFSGFASGSLGANPFTNRAFTVALLGDLADKVSGGEICNGSLLPDDDGLPVIGSFDIAGVGAGTYASPLVLFSGYLFTGSGIAYVSCQEGGGGLTGVDPVRNFDPRLRTGMQQTFPERRPNGTGGIPSNAGVLQFTDLDSLSLSSAPVEVPEPSSWALVVTGLGALVAARRRYRA